MEYLTKLNFDWSMSWLEDSTPELKEAIAKNDMETYATLVNNLYEKESKPIKIVRAVMGANNVPFCEMQNTISMTIKEFEDLLSIETGETPNNLEIEVSII